MTYKYFIELKTFINQNRLVLMNIKQNTILYLPYILFSPPIDHRTCKISKINFKSLLIRRVYCIITIFNINIRYFSKLDSHIRNFIMMSGDK